MSYLLTDTDLLLQPDGDLQFVLRYVQISRTVHVERHGERAEAAGVEWRRDRDERQTVVADDGRGCQQRAYVHGQRVEGDPSARVHDVCQLSEQHVQVDAG